MTALLLHCVAAWLLVGCSAAIGGGDGAIRSAPAPAPLSAVAIERHIELLADDALEGREAGTAGDERAIEYIVDALRAAGLDAVERQSFEFVAGARLGSPNALSIGGREVAPASFRPLAFSASARGTWPAVFVGYGISAPELGHDDYAGTEARGKIAVALATSPDGSNPHGRFAPHAGARSRALEAASNGAAGLLLIYEAEREGDESDAGPLPRFSGSNVSRDVGIPVVAVTAMAASELLGIDSAAARERLDEHERLSRNLWTSVSLTVSIDLERRTSSNVLGWLRARHHAAVDEVVIVGAHHDHLGRGISGAMRRNRVGEVHNGADDNASGVAGIIELARALAPRAATLRRHVLFMTLGAEEWGLLGSKHFADHPLLRVPAGDGRAETPVDAIAMINMDMVGRMREDRLLASGLATSTAWPELLDRALADGSHDIDVAKESDREILGSSDHTSFYQMGMPVVFFFTGGHEQYHTPDDDLYRELEDGTRERLVNVDGLSRILAYIADVIVAVANRDERLPLVEGIELTPRMSFRVVLRLMPDYGADVEGMRVASVSDGGPAAAAGMAAGDVIVRFGDIAVRSVRDYMVGLQQASPGEPVSVEIERDGERQVLSVTPLGLPSK